MNYAAHYERLIARARGRSLVGYRERHHLLPRCMGGGNENENIVELTGEEHYVAHQLLVKIHPENVLLVHAANFMSAQCVGDKSFGWLRRRNALAVSIRERGKVCPEERKAKVSKKLKGRIISKKHRAKIANALRGVPKSTQHIANNANARRGYKHTPEAREKMRNAIRKPKTAEHLARISAAMRAYHANKANASMVQF